MKKKFVQLSFKQFVVSVIPYAVIALYVSISFAYLVNSLIEKQVHNDTVALAKSAEYEVRLRFETPSIALNSLVGALEKDSGRDYDSVKALVTSMGDQYPQCSAFYLAALDGFGSRDGTVVMSNGADTVSDRQRLEQFFAAPIAAKGALYSSESQDTVTGKPVIAFTRAVYDQGSHKLIGVAGCYLLLDQLAVGLAPLTTSDQEHINIVDQNGVFLTHSDASYVKTKNYFDVSPLGKKYKASEYLDGTERVLNEGGHYYGVRKLGESPWFVIIEGPTSIFTGKSYFWMIIINAVTIFLILQAIVYTTWYMNRMRGKERELGDKMFTETQNLAVAAKENAATSQDQSAAVKEIVATMEDNNALSENIAVKIKDVSSVAGKTSSDVSDGVSHLELNVSQLREIAEANKNTISGIKNLSEKIDNIWDIVTLINSVADQAKIIAFNAELEASSAGEAGKNFHIVATEIRRLADGIIDGTKEIKEKINEIQQSSDSLILASENGTVKIEEGCDTARSLEERFESIKNASEVTAASASDITTIIQQQAAASEQILITLKQIAAGVENFTAATESISSASQNLKAIAVELNEQTAQQGGGQE
ncbi:MAG: hypothetical protein IJR93_10930 [Treponema sp.]|nr:hypothetical protein [Treponema sp.]